MLARHARPARSPRMSAQNVRPECPPRMSAQNVRKVQEEENGLQLNS